MKNDDEKYSVRNTYLCREKSYLYKNLTNWLKGVNLRCMSEIYTFLLYHGTYSLYHEKRRLGKGEKITQISLCKNRKLW